MGLWFVYDRDLDVGGIQLLIKTIKESFSFSTSSHQFRQNVANKYRSLNQIVDKFN